MLISRSCSYQYSQPFVSVQCHVLFITGTAKPVRLCKCVRSGKVNTVTITFDTPTRLSMIRLWNYNKSRIHSYRGARLVSIELDGQRVFEGEIRKAIGAMGAIEQNSGTVRYLLANTP